MGEKWQVSQKFARKMWENIELVNSVTGMSSPYCWSFVCLKYSENILQDTGNLFQTFDLELDNNDNDNSI